MEVGNETVETSAKSSLSTTTRTRKKQELPLTNDNVDIVQGLGCRAGVLESQTMTDNDIPMNSSQSLLLTPELVLYNGTMSVRAILGLKRTNRLSETMHTCYQDHLQPPRRA